MLEIPTGAAAREAWKALPDNVRAEVAASAEHGEPHPDPAIAAIVVGALRHSSFPHWADGLQLALLTTVVGGSWLGVFMIAQGDAHNWVDSLFVITIALVPLLALGRAGLTRLLDHRKPTAPPADALTPSLRALLLLPQTPMTPQPMTIRRRHPFLPIFLAALPFAVVYGYLLARWTGRSLDLRGGAQDLLVQAAVIAVISVVVRLALRHERKLRREAPMPIRLTDAGLTFGRRRTIPWSDVQGVYVTADTLEWVVRDQPHLVMDFDATRTRPEDIVLAARAYAESVSLGQRVMR